jgi:hypothetical protein
VPTTTHLTLAETVVEQVTEAEEDLSSCLPNSKEKEQRWVSLQDQGQRANCPKDGQTNLVVAVAG